MMLENKQRNLKLPVTPELDQRRSSRTQITQNNASTKLGQKNEEVIREEAIVIIVSPMEVLEDGKTMNRTKFLLSQYVI